MPLVAFFFLAPILFIVSHAYTLVHFVMLAAKVGVFDKELRRAARKCARKRRKVCGGNCRAIFSSNFSRGRGPPQRRAGMAVESIAWISLVIGPVLLLLLIQVQFLPYHSKGSLGCSVSFSPT